ncbi:MAG: putative lipopolysaccharide heptosyltransferase III [Chlamydiota bacterium]
MTYGDYPDLERVKKVLVVKMRHLGDVLLTAPVFSVLKKRLPGAQVDAYVYEEAFPMLAGHPAIGVLIGYDRKWKKLGFLGRLRKEWALLRKIRKEKYDLVVNLTEGDRGVIVAMMSGAQVRVGFEPKGKWQKKVYTHVAKHCPGLRHTVERNLDVLRRIGLFPEMEERELFLEIPEEARSAMRERVGGESFFLIHPTSRWRFKCWPVEKMRELCRILVGRGIKLVFTSGPDGDEIAMVDEIAEGLDVIRLSGKISLKELGALIEMSEILICVDSVPLHMASALQKPVVAIFGPTSDVTWGPWRNVRARIVSQNLSCRPCYRDGCGGSKRSDCLDTLSVSQVLKAIGSLQPEIFSEIALAGACMGQEFVHRS